MGAYTFSACKLLLKWPGGNNLLVLKKQNIFIHICTAYTLYICEGMEEH